jgi:DNA-binding response OmpR family regulator
MHESVPSPASARGPLVLLMEPEPMLRLTMTKFLQRSGYRVTACSDALAAEALLRDADLRPALIVLGVRVLDRDAVAAAHRLHKAAPGTPMLGVADALEELGDAPALPDTLRFLAHPFDMPDVLRAIRSSLRQSGASPRQSGAEAAIGS